MGLGFAFVFVRFCSFALFIYVFMFLSLLLSTMYGVFWVFCFFWSKVIVFRGVSLEFIFFRSCRAGSVSTA